MGDAHRIESVERLRERMGQPSEFVQGKVNDFVDDFARDYIARAAVCIDPVQAGAGMFLLAAVLCVISALIMRAGLRPGHGRGVEPLTGPGQTSRQKKMGSPVFEEGLDIR